MKSVHITETLRTVYVYIYNNYIYILYIYIYTIYIYYIYIYSISYETLKNENCMWYLYIYIYNIHYTVHVINYLMISKNHSPSDSFINGLVLKENLQETTIFPSKSGVFLYIFPQTNPLNSKIASDLRRNPSCIKISDSKSSGLGASGSRATLLNR